MANLFFFCPFISMLNLDESCSKERLKKKIAIKGTTPKRDTEKMFWLHFVAIYLCLKLKTHTGLDLISIALRGVAKRPKQPESQANEWVIWKRERCAQMRNNATIAILLHTWNTFGRSIYPSAPSNNVNKDTMKGTIHIHTHTGGVGWQTR